MYIFAHIYFLCLCYFSETNIVGVFPFHVLFMPLDLITLKKIISWAYENLQLLGENILLDDPRETISVSIKRYQIAKSFFYI